MALSFSSTTKSDAFLRVFQCAMARLMRTAELRSLTVIHIDNSRRSETARRGGREGQVDRTGLRQTDHTQNFRRCAATRLGRFVYCKVCNREHLEIADTDSLNRLFANFQPHFGHA